MNTNTIAKNVTETLIIESLAIKEIAESFDKEIVCKIVETLGKTEGKIIIAGCGTSGAAAKKIAHSLCCVERPALFMSPSDAVHGGLGVLQKDDVLILISKGGNTKELINLIHACEKKGGLIIGVSENENSHIGKKANLFLKIKVDREPCPFNMLATASTLAVISIFDAICIALMEYTNYTKEQFAIIHPGGAVGEKLLNTTN